VEHRVREETGVKVRLRKHKASDPGESFRRVREEKDISRQRTYFDGSPLAGSSDACENTQAGKNQRAYANPAGRNMHQVASHGETDVMSTM